MQIASPEDDGDRRGVETCITVLKGAPTVDTDAPIAERRMNDGT